MTTHSSGINFSCHYVANSYGSINSFEGSSKVTSLHQSASRSQKTLQLVKTTKTYKFTVLFDITISQTITYNGLSNVMEGVSRLLFLLCSTAKHNRECKVVMLFTDRFITGNIVITDFPSGWPSALTLM